MDGIKIKGKKKEEHYGNDRKLSRIDYGFEELIAPIQGFIDNFYWILGNQDFTYFEDLSNKYDEIIIEESKNLLRLTKRGFVTEYAKHVIPDWGRIYGIKERIVLSAIKINDEFVEKNVEIYFSCVDGAYWEIYAKNRDIIKMLCERFPFSEPITLADKK